MIITKRWTITLKNKIYGSMQPQLDTFDNSAFYISDGWGSSYGSMRLRKISFETGEELGSAVLRDGTRCVHINEDYIFAILNKRIVKLNRSDMKVLHTYKKGVPFCADYVSANQSNTLLLMNSMGNFLNIFNYQTETVKKKKVVECCGIEKMDEDHYLVFNFDSVLEYSLEKNRLKQLLNTGIYKNYVMGQSGQIYFICQDDSKNETASRIIIYESIHKNKSRAIDPGIKFNNIQLSADEKLLYLYSYHGNSLSVYSLEEGKIVFEYMFPDCIVAIFDNLNVFITSNDIYRTDDPMTLTCWEFENS